VVRGSSNRERSTASCQGSRSRPWGAEKVVTLALERFTALVKAIATDKRALLAK